MWKMVRYYWIVARGYRLNPWNSPYLRWRFETFLGSEAAGLDPARFVRIHRSYIVNFERVARIEPYGKDSRLAILTDGTRLPVSRTGYARLKSLLDDRV